MSSLEINTPFGTGVREGVGYRIYSIVVDNPNAGYVYLPSANQFVPPNVTGYVAALQSGTGIAEAQFVNPAGVVLAPVVMGTVKLTFTSDVLPANPGTPIVGNILGPFVVDATVNLANAIGTNSITPPQDGQTGDWLMLVVAVDNQTNGTNPGIAVPAGFAQMMNSQATQAAGACRIRAFSKRYDPAPIVTVTTAPPGGTVNLACILVRNASGPSAAVAAGINNAAGTVLLAQEVDGTPPNALVFYAMCSTLGGQGVTFAPPLTPVVATGGSPDTTISSGKFSSIGTPYEIATASQGWSACACSVGVAFNP